MRKYQQQQQQQQVLKMYLVVYSLEQQHADFMCVCVYS